MLRNPTRVEKHNTQKIEAEAVSTKGTGGSCSGQAMLEYVIIITLVCLLMIGAMGVFMSTIHSFYLNIVKVVALPFP